MRLEEVDYKTLQINALSVFGEDWTIVSAGNENGGYNGMTIAWGALGSVWEEKSSKGIHRYPTATVYIRPNRYTKKFMDENDKFTITTFAKDKKRILGYMGGHSGRDEDKVKNAGLTPVFVDGTVGYEEAELIFVCRKMYASPIVEEGFVDQNVMNSVYPKKDFHTMYIGEVEHVYRVIND